MEDNLQKRVGFGPRFGAYIIDGIFMLIIAIIMAFAFGAAGAAVGADAGADASVGIMEKIAGEDLDAANVDWEGNEDANTTAGGIFGAFLGALLGIVLGMIAYTLIEAFTGASLGKMILGLKAGTLDGKHGSVSLYLGRAALKNVSIFPLLVAAIIPASFDAMNIVSNILSLIVFIGCFFVFRESKQSLHDQLGKTAIYYKKDLSE